MSPSRWANFHVWRGRLPHWRADDVLYYVTFRHRRPLDENEREDLFRALRRPDGRGWDLVIVCVLPEQTDLIVAQVTKSEKADRLTNIVERSKARAGKAIVKRTEERFAPFYGESYDRILRDEAERDAFIAEILARPVELGLVEDPNAYPHLWVGSI